MIYDVIVCGGGPSGIAAAISARRNGARVLLVEQSGLLGGNSVHALVGPWMSFHYGKTQVIKGIGQEIVQRMVKKGYSLSHIPDPIGFCDTITPHDVEGLKEVLFELMDEEQIDLLLHALIINVIRDENTIKGLKAATKSGIIDLFGKVIIDATGDGDVAYKMGCDYVFGRNTDNFAQPMTMIFSVGNVKLDELKAYLKNNPDDFTLDENYDGEYLAISGCFRLVEEARKNGDFTIARDRVLLFQDVRPNQVAVNMTRIQKHSGVDAWSLTEAEREGRRQIKEVFAFLKKYVPGFKDSFIVRTPSKIGVRETRHILGDYIMELDDIVEERSFEDSVCVCAYPIDIHSPDGSTLTVLEENKQKCYEIPLRVMLPKKAEQLIVTGRAISATHEANASMRVTPSVLALGEAAGALASIAIKKNIKPRQVDYKEVQAVLRKQGQIVSKNDI
jgi:hypothetical protein